MPRMGTLRCYVALSSAVVAAVANFDWIPIQVNSCTAVASCDAYVQCGSSAASDDTSSGKSPDKPYKTLAYAVAHRVTGQTIHIMDGTCQLTQTVKLDNVEDLVIKAYEGHSPKIAFTNINAAFAGKNVKRLRLEGLEIEGPNAQLSYEEAMEDRERKVRGEAWHLSGKGVSITSGDHIQFSDLKVHHCPGAGLRVNHGDYLVIQDCEVYGNTWWGSSAESAIVFAESINVDDSDVYKMVMRRNVVYDNMNKIPYYNPKYAWNYSPIASGVNCNQDTCNPDSSSFSVGDCPWQCRYGKSYQNFICDGMGVYVTRNSDTYKHGRMWLANNTAYGNGINGVVFHRTDRGMIRDNILYDNGALPTSAGGAEDWQKPLVKGRQPYAGLTINNAYDLTLEENTVRAPYSSDFAYAMEYDGSSKAELNSGSTGNAVCEGKHFSASLGPSGLFDFPSCSSSDGRCCLKAGELMV